MPVNVTCDHCGQNLQVAEEHGGKQVRCPKCFQVFIARPAVAAAAAAAPGVPESSPSAPAPKFCPHCGTALNQGGSFCAGCGRSPSEPVSAGVSVPSYAPSTVPLPYAPAQSTSGLAIASLVLGILSFVTCMGPLLGIPGVICGHLAKGQIRKGEGNLQGDGMATWGLVLSYLGILLACGFLGIGMMGSHHSGPVRHF